MQINTKSNLITDNLSKEFLILKVCRYKLMFLPHLEKKLALYILLIEAMLHWENKFFIMFFKGLPLIIF